MHYDRPPPHPIDILKLKHVQTKNRNLTGGKMKLRYASVSMAISLLAIFSGMRMKPDDQKKIEIPKESQKCIECHSANNIADGAIRDWKLSKHAENGIACADCHIPTTGVSKEIVDEPTKCDDKSVRRKVSAKQCAMCHDKQYEQFAQSKHALAWVAMNAMPTTAIQPHAIIEGEKGCGGCHRVGRDDGRCDVCHTRHLFSAAEARHPEACQTCHMGFDHPQWEMYSTSKHGTIYEIEGKNWNFNQTLSEMYRKTTQASDTTARAPVCQTCHMPNGDHGVKTAWGFLAVRLPESDKEWLGYRMTILKGLGVLDENGKPTERLKVVEAGQVARLNEKEWNDRREAMVQVCEKCHSESFARQNLAQADSVIKASDKLVAEAVQVVDSLYQEGILKKPKDQPFSVDMLRFYESPSPIEQKLYTMFLEHRMRAFQGAFHMNPDYMHWYGWAELKRDLVEIKAEAAQLRRERNPEVKKKG